MAEKRNTDRNGDRRGPRGSGGRGKHDRSGGDRRGGSGRREDSDRSTRDRHDSRGSDRTHDRERGGHRQGSGRKPWSPEGEVPRWIADEVARVTPKQRIAPTLDHIKRSARAFASGRYGKALEEAERAKELSSRDATVRELIGLSAYRLGRWDESLRELRAFRRFTGETTHMPVEMDVLRALDRPRDVEEAWKTFRRLRGRRDTEREARVVYGSFLLDQGDDHRAWEVTAPKRIVEDPPESELRVWFVAARAAARLGDRRTARRLYQAIEASDPAFPGLDELDQATSAA